MATQTLGKLISAGYFYFLRNETDPTPVLLDFLSQTYRADDSGVGFDLGLGEPALATTTDKFVANDTSDSATLELQKKPIANVLGIGLIKYSASDGEPDWERELRFFQECGDKFREAGLNVLGSTLIGIADRSLAENLDQYQSSIGRPLSPVKSEMLGNTVHQFLGDPNQQYFFIEDTAEPDLADIITKEFPHVVWLMQRMNREMKFFEDQMETIESEKKEIDNKLSGIFHQKVGKVMTPELAEQLEEQVNNLASMYSMMATDLHLVSEAVDTFDRDIGVLEEKAAEISDGSESSFPGYRLHTFRDYLSGLIKARGGLSQSLENTKAAIDITQTQAELLRGGQGLAVQEQTRELLNQNVQLQDERASLQAAASVVELVVIFYYTLVSWKTVASKGSVEALDPLVKFGAVGFFAFSVVILTHFVGISLHKKKFQVLPILISGLFAVSSLAAMALLPSPVH